MFLSDWVSREGRGAITKLMRDTGLAYSTVHAIVAGDAIARRGTAKLIHEATGGQVSEEDLLLGRVGERPKRRVA